MVVSPKMMIVHFLSVLLFPRLLASPVLLFLSEASLLFAGPRDLPLQTPPWADSLFAF